MRERTVQRDIERERDLLVAELCPGEQQQRLAIGNRHRLQRLGQARAEHLGLELLERLCRRLELGEGQRSPIRSILPPGGAKVVAQQVGGDAVEPRPRVFKTPVVAPAVVKRTAEDLRRYVLPRGRGPARAVRVKRSPVAVEDQRELLRVTQRAFDHRGIGELAGGLLKARPPQRPAECDWLVDRVHGLGPISRSTSRSAGAPGHEIN
jgi:hypothetical protein